MGGVRRVELPGEAAKLWDERWAAAIAREEVARGLERADFDGRPGSDFERDCLRALLPDVESEVAELRMLDRQRRWHMAGLAFVVAVVGAWIYEVNTAGSLLDWPGAPPPGTLWPLLVIATGTTALLTLRGIVARQQRLLEVRMRLGSTLDGLLLPYLRHRINAALRVPFDALDVQEANGLAETVDPSLEVTTRARQELTSLVERMGSGAIGVSGSRGAGKSTLIRAACGGRLTPPGLLPTVGVSISAPVRWEASEFVPLLFAELCKAVAPELGEPAHARGGRLDLLRGFVTLGAAAVLLYVAGAVGTGRTTIEAEHLEAAALLLVAAAVVVVSMPLLRRAALPALAALVPRRLRRPLPRLGRPTLAATAARCLQELRFRETIVKGWSLGGSSPLGLSLNGKRELSATRQPLTLPEVVARYKQFVRRVAQEHTIVIGIDELDKMASADEAARFLGDVKVLFGEQPCFYLVSVSDDAMSEFERRGVPLRTVFDSTFDDVLHVEALSFAEARAIVNGRVVGMGDGCIALCYALGDGIPRELIRYVRGAIEAVAQGARTLTEIACVLVADRQRRIERAAASVALRELGGGDHPLLDWLRALPDPTPEALPLRWDAAGFHAAIGAPDGGAQRALLLELAAIAYRAATAIALAGALDEDLLEAATREREPSPLLSLLARAGRDLGHGPRTAWRTVDAARTELGLVCVPFPLDVPPRPPPTAPELPADSPRGRLARALVALLR
jgi:hypothetical protein